MSIRVPSDVRKANYSPQLPLFSPGSGSPGEFSATLTSPHSPSLNRASPQAFISINP